MSAANSPATFLRTLPIGHIRLVIAFSSAHLIMAGPRRGGSEIPAERS
jgi:hypothetical protein